MNKMILAWSLRGIMGLFLLILIISEPQAQIAKETVRAPLKIGVLAIRGVDKATAQWTDTIEFLDHNLPGHDVKMAPILLDDLKGAVLRKEIDFVIVNPGAFIELERQFDAVAMATMVVKRSGNVVTEFGGVIFTRSDRNDISDLVDIQNKSLIAVSQNAFGGYQVAKREFFAHGINLDNDIGQLQFSGFPQDKVVYAIRDKKADVGTVRTGILEAMAAEGKINLKDFKILNKVAGGFPLALSTTLYPEWAFANLSHVSPDLTKKVALLLYQIQPEDPASQTGKYFGWATPSSYTEVHNLFRDIKVGPDNTSFKLIPTLREYWIWLVLVVVSLIAFSLRSYVTAIVQTIILRRLNDRGRMVMLAMIMGGVACTVSAIAFVGLYSAAFEQQKIQLKILAKSQKNLIESVAQFNAAHSNDDHKQGVMATTLNQISNALWHFDNGNEDEEILLAHRVQNKIVYLARTRIQDHSLPRPADFSKSSDIAMYLALNGQSGIIETINLQGEKFLAAYEPLPSLKSALVARLGIKEIERPFIIAGISTSAGALLVIILGVFLFRQVSTPLIQNLETAVEGLADAQRIAHIGSWTWDIAGDRIEWSNEIYRIFGHAPQSFDATFSAFIEAVHPDDRQAVQEAVKIALETKEPYHIEHRIVLPNDDVRYVEEQGEVTLTALGEPAFMRGVVNDITERKQSEQAILELNENLERRVDERTVELKIAIAEHQQTQELLIYNETMTKAVVGSAADGIITINETGLITSFNSAAEKIFGWSVIEAVGKNITILMPHDDAQKHDGYLLRYMMTKEPTAIGISRELFGKRKDGSEFPMELAVSVTEVGQRQMFTGIIRDISERKKLDAELENKEKRLRDTLNNMPGAIIFTDESANIVVCNDRFTELCEVPKELLSLGSSYENVFQFRAERGDYGPGAIDDLVAARVDSLHNPSEKVFEDIIPNGRILEVRRRPAEGGGVVTVITDITEHKRAEDELRQALDTLKQAQNELVQSEKMASLGGLVAGVAHEINTPVGISVTAASYLEDAAENLKSSFNSGTMKKSDLNDFIDTAEQSTRMISSNLRRASDLIGSFKQVAVDQSSQERRVFMVSPYLEEILMSLHPQLKQTSHQVSIDCSPDIEIDSYPGALSQIVTNLVMNSLVHAFDETDKGNIRLSVAETGSNIKLEYTDDGCGMDDETTAKVFDPFFTTKRGSGGSGLGMNILFNLITQTLGGSVSCSSNVGEGTLFSITIPKQAKQNQGKRNYTG